MLDTVMEIPDLATLRAKVLVNEVDAGKVKPGQTAQVDVDAVQGKVFAGRLRLRQRDPEAGRIRSPAESCREARGPRRGSCRSGPA